MYPNLYIAKIEKFDPQKKKKKLINVPIRQQYKRALNNEVLYYTFDVMGLVFLSRQSK